MFNSSNQVKSSGNAESKLIIGSDTAKVISVKLGSQEKDGETIKSLQFWLKSTLGGSANYNITVSSADRKASKNETYEFIDQFGNTAWAKNLSSVDTSYSYKDKKTGEMVTNKRDFDLDTARRAKTGESDFTKFVRSLFNIPKDVPTYEKLSQFTKGSMFVSLQVEDSQSLKDMNQFIKDSGKELFVNYTVYTKQDGTLANRVLPIFASSLTSAIYFTKELTKYAERQNAGEYAISDVYSLNSAVEFANYGKSSTNFPTTSSSVASKIDDENSLPF